MDKNATNNVNHNNSNESYVIEKKSVIKLKFLGENSNKRQEWNFSPIWILQPGENQDRKRKRELKEKEN